MSAARPSGGRRNVGVTRDAIAAGNAQRALIIDAHQHFWDPALADYPWLTEEFAPIRRRFDSGDLAPVLRRNGVSGTVLVQSRSSLDETRLLLETAAATPFVLGVVGWIDLADPGATRVLEDLRAAPGGEWLVGLRHQVHDEPDPNWLLRGDVQRGIAAVAEAGLAYDFLVRARELRAAFETASRHPDLRFVVDHLAKPPVTGADDDAWADQLSRLASLPNVVCKLSGLVTEAEWQTWQPEQLLAYLHRSLEWFGTDRVMFGSDWPVCLLAATYEDVLGLVRAAINGLGPSDQAAVLAGTALRTYRLEKTD
jgi:L-fuconolactonase